VFIPGYYSFPLRRTALCFPPQRHRAPRFRPPPPPVTFASQSDSATGVQFDLQYDPTALTLTATVGDAVRFSGKSLYLWDLAPGQRRFLIVGLNRDPVTDGALVNLFVNISPSVPAGSYPLKILNIVASDSFAQAVAVKGIDGVVAVQGTAGSGSRLQPAGVLNGASLVPGPVHR
jgi:hypothetical protein